MINYIINFVICSGLLLLVYRVFLGTENLYRFNRFYLLFSLVFSLVVPATTIHVPYLNTPAWDKLLTNQPARPQTAIQLMPIEAAQRQATTPVNAATNDMGDEPTAERINAAPSVNNSVQPGIVSRPQPQPARHYLPEILMALYGLITLVLLVRFVWNSYHITRIVANSTVIDYQDTKLVLVTDDVTPHSFLKYVFLNKSAYYNKTIEPEIICHEQTHVRQLHSLDVIWVELLQIVCWFNFFIPLYRKAIRLNHEFLADEAVIENYRDTPAYQHLLLAKASQSGSLYLTSQFNYVVTKKRIMMMSKNTTAAIALYKRLALLPVLAVAVFLFSQKGLAQNAPKAKPATKKQIAKKVAPQSILEEYAVILKKYGFPPDTAKLKEIYTPPYPKHKILGTPNFSKKDRARLITLFKQMSHEQQNQQWVIFLKSGPPLARVSVSERQLNNWKNPKAYGVWVDEKKINNVALNKYKATDFDQVSISKLTTAALHHTEYQYQVNLMTKAYYARYVKETKAKSTKYFAMAHIPGINKTTVVYPPQRKKLSTKNADTAIKTAHKPLIVIDGQPFNKPIPAGFDFSKADDEKYADLLSLPLTKIKSIAVIKDQSAKKLWGDQGAYGVISITTKRQSTNDDSVKHQANIVKPVNKDEQPMIVVDGKVIDKKFPSGFSTDNEAQTVNLLSVSPADIQSVKVIKDTSAIAKWGKRAANGVVIFTTKRGTEKKQQN